MVREVISGVFLLAAGALAIIAAIGVARLRTTAARLHAAGKASPGAFLLAAVGAAIDLGGGGAAALILAALAIVITLPIGVHLLFRSMTNERGGDDTA